MMKRYGAQYGYGAEADAITTTTDAHHHTHYTVADPVAKAHILGLREDLKANTFMGGVLTENDAVQLRKFLGREATPTELYAAHFFGERRAESFLGDLQSTPDADASSLFGTEAASNRPTFYGKNGHHRSLREISDLWSSDMARGQDQPTPPTEPQEPQQVEVHVFVEGLPAKVVANGARVTVKTHRTRGPSGE